ncbi:hypothetical protein DI09_3p600 [Mitosporidium daphniae]|uniref:Protein AF-9 homolog n=1 Tax=Mitosporidium daphniae TaxID=1485682 RepID=A0A098VQK0_9MICR|nr:uncharacterized protein DI09_3p600 [Mitosporidium daphniae]KGG51298.1 hypothetical protein DI09_3p600 [Mitosporidium daphniae]|eukprot:XP_013237725.1 uncharacterized protein DI09_3p600 [Mitosporidium daphniae]
MPLRSVEKWPFEISELGWGEFEVQIKIFLKDSISKPLQLVHFLRLYPSEENGILLPIPPPSPLISVIAESYNEIVPCSSNPLGNLLAFAKVCDEEGWHWEHLHPFQIGENLLAIPYRSKTRA